MFAILVHHYNAPAVLNPEVFQTRAAAEAEAAELASLARYDEEMAGSMFARSYAEVIEIRLV